MLGTDMTNKDAFRNRAAACEAADDIRRSPADAETIGDVILRRYSRRDVMRGTLGVTAAGALFGASAFRTKDANAEETVLDRFDFAEIESGVDKTHHVAPGYRANILLRWGDPLHPDMGPFSPGAQSQDDQLKRFGYNNDYVAYFPIEGSSRHGLLCVNHEYTNEELMFESAKKRQDTSGFKETTQDMVDVEMAAHGVTIVEIVRDEDGWHTVLGSAFNRRISPLTAMTIDGPAAEEDHARLKTGADPTGKKLIGTLNNCAGGMTPWGTYLTAEENFHNYFWTGHCQPGGAIPEGLGGDQKDSFKRYGIPGLWQAWGKYYDRFNIDKEPNEPNRFGWIVEIDPFDPNSTPVKYTALGRFCHEGAECVVNKDGRVVVYSGDDSRFEYVYRFVSDGRYEEGDTAANKTLLSKGTLSVARYDADGTVHWLPLVREGSPWLTDDFGFKTQGDVLINARLAAQFLGATPMDRPEDIQPNKETGRVYVMLTNNTSRQPGTKLAKETNPANPRPDNRPYHRNDPAGRRSRGGVFRLGASGEVRRSRHWPGGRAVEPLCQQGRMVRLARQCRRGRRGPAVDRHRPGRQLGAHRKGGRALRLGDGGAAQADPKAVLPGAYRRGDVRPLLHAGRRDPVRGRAAPGRRRRGSPDRLRPPLDL